MQPVRAEAGKKTFEVEDGRQNWQSVHNVSSVIMSEGERRRLMFVPVAAARLVFGYSKDDLDMGMSEEQCIAYMRDLVAARQWARAVWFYISCRDQFSDWKYMLIQTLAAAIICLAESDELNDLLEDIRNSEEDKDIVYYATVAALDYVGPREIEDREAIRSLLRGRYRAEWIEALYEQKERNAIIDVLDHVSGDDMTESERFIFCYTLIKKRRYKRVAAFLDRWPSEWSSYHLARWHGGGVAFAKVAHRLLNSGDPDLRNGVIKDLTFLGVAGWKIYDEGEGEHVTFAQRLSAWWIFIQLTLLLLALPVAWPLKLLFTSLRWGLRFIFVRVY